MRAISVSMTSFVADSATASSRTRISTDRAEVLAAIKRKRQNPTTFEEQG